MRRYLKKIVPAIAVVIVFAVASFIDVPRNLDSFMRSVQPEENLREVVILGMERFIMYQ